jgi:hypothetical protein
MLAGEVDTSPRPWLIPDDDIDNGGGLCLIL